MKIKKTPPKKLAVPIPPIKNLIQRLTECQEEEIPSIAASVQEWNYPRGDLFHWIGVLNRFDTILENVCQSHKLKKLQSRGFTPTERSKLLAILKFSRLLLENCTNRNLYSSYEHLNDLLNTVDLDVLEALLRLLLRPAQRLSNQRGLRTNFSISHDRILILAHTWGSKEFDLGMKDLAYDDVVIPEELKTLSYQFYRHLTPTEAAGTAADKKLDTTLAFSTLASKHKRKESTSSSSAVKTNEGITVISISNIHDFGENDIDILNNVIEEYGVPEEFHFALLNRIRIATSINSPEKRRQLLINRILAIAVMAHVVPEHIAQSKLFLYEPDIVVNLAELVHSPQKNLPERGIPYEIQTVAFYALDGISRYRTKLGEVLTAINASANHGILLYVMRRIIADLENPQPVYPQEYLDALFALIQCIISTQNGGTMVTSAGIVPTLLQLLHNKNPTQLKNVTKAVVILDSLVYGFSASFTTFCNANGVTILVRRIKDEVDYDVQLANETLNQMEDVTTTTSQSETSTATKDLPYERFSLLKSMFKFVLHMMQTSGTADGLRNLIETSLPESLNKVLDNPIFGSSIYALAIHLMATFIHNEPTSLPIMQEARLPQTFLKSISSDIPASIDVIQQIPNAFGAICLNATGLEMFNEANPIDKFFSIFTSTEHVRVIQDSGVASSIGNSVDELMRHHPSLKPIAMNAIMAMLTRITEIGQGTITPVNDDNNRLHAAPIIEESDDTPRSQSITETVEVTMSDSDANKSDEKKENIVVSLIEIAAKFLDGLFQNSSHCKDFLKQNGLDVLVKFYALPTLPYDFGNTPASYALSNSMRHIADVDAKTFVKSVILALSEALNGAKDLLEYEGKGARILEYTDLQENDLVKVEEANKTFRSLVTLYGFVGLLSDIYYTPGFPQNKSSPSVIEAFVADQEVLPALGKLHRACVWENVILKSSVPRSWYSSPNKLRKSSVPESSSFGTSSLDEGDRDVDANDPPADPNDRKVKNIKSLKFLVSQIPSCLTPLFQGLTKMLLSRKTPDPNQKKQASKVSDSIAEVLRDHLIWKRYESESDSNNKYSYLTIMLGLLSLLFLDERNQMALQTMLVISLNEVNGLDCIFTLLRKLWEDAEGIKVSEEHTEVDDGSKEKLTRIHACLEVTLNFFQFVTSSKLLHESPHTSTLISKERDHFDPHEFLVDVRAKVFPVINELWQSDYLQKAPANIIKSIIQNLVQILKGEGEVNQRPEGSSSMANPSVFGRNVVPDEQRIRQLCDMGFPRPAAEIALLRCNNQVETAAEYLLTHPHVVADAVGFAAESSESAAGTQGNNTQQGDPQTGTTTDPANDEQAENVSSAEEDEGAEGVLEQAPTLPVADPRTEEVSDAPVPMETDPVTKKVEKGKGKEVPTIDQFKTLREEVKESAAQRTIELLNKVDDIIFEVKDLFLLLSKEKFESTIEFVYKSIEDVAEESILADSQGKKILGTRLRLLALLLNEPSVQNKVPAMPLNIFPIVFKLITSEKDLPSTSPLSNWLAPALLVIEAFISLADEPTTVPLDNKPEDVKESEDVDMSTVTVTDEQRVSLLAFVLTLLEKRDLDKDVRHALLRILVRITRRHPDAVEFAKRNGLQILFNAFRAKAHDFHRQQLFIIMILRHIVEDSQVLESIMDREIKNSFSHSRPRMADTNISAYLRSTCQFALRDPQIFVQSTKKVCKLTRYDSSGRNQQITLIRPEETEEPANTEQKESPTNEEEMTDVIPSTSTAAAAEKTKKSTNSSEVSENLIHFLANELMSIREQTSAQNKPDSEKQIATSETSSGNATINPISISSEFKPEDHADYLARCFLLQCLTELLSSYPSCKMDVVNLSRRKNSTGPHTSSKHRTGFINYLLSDLLPYGCITPSTDIGMRKRHGQSRWTVSFFVALCSSNNESDDKNPDPELLQIRKFVLDCIIRSFNNAITSTDPIEAKYGRLLALAELCYSILNSRPISNANVNRPIDDGPASVAKLMLDKKFVDTLTSALAEVDLNYPTAKVLINAILKPFEFLTKIAIKIGRSPDPSAKVNKEQQPRHDSAPSDPSSSEEEIDTEAMDTPDLYQHSVLGTLEGRVPSEVDDGTMDTTEDDEEPYDDEEYEEESELSDDDSGDDDDEGDDMDVEIVVRQQSVPHHSGVSDNDDDEEEDEDPDFEGVHTPAHHATEEHHENDSEEENDDQDAEGQDLPWGNVNETAMIDHGDIEEVIENGEGRRRRHIRNERFGQDDSADRDIMLVEEDEDDDDDVDDDVDDDDDDDDDVGENDVIIPGGDTIDDGYEDRLNFWGWNNHNSSFGNDDELGAPIRPGRAALFSFGNRRHRGITGRRAILEVPPDSLEYLWGDPSDQGRHDYLGGDSDLTGLGRSRPLTTNVDDVSAHPLLVNRSPALPTIPGPDISRGRSSRNGPLDWTQSIEELIGGGAVQLLEQLLNRGRGLSTYRLELNPTPSGLVSGIEVDRMFSRPITTGQDTASVTITTDPVTAVAEFQPAPTSQRWYNEAQIMYGSSFADKSTKLVNHILNALVPQALIEEKKRKEKEEKEREERRIKEEEEREEARKREEEERARIEAERAASTASTETQSLVEMAETDIVIEDAPQLEQVAEIENTATAMEEEMSLAPVNQMEELITAELVTAELASADVTTVMEEDEVTATAPMEAEPSPVPENVVTEPISDVVTTETEPTDNTTTVTVTTVTEIETAQGSTSTETAEGSSTVENTPQQQRTTVIVNGEPVDITDTGIDPTFLEALPDELRAEVLAEHLPRNRTRPATGANEISPEFLQALPDELRDEVLQQQQDLERERQERERPSTGVPAEMDNATFFATLDPQLRQQVLLEQDEVVLQSLPPSIVAEVHSLRERANRRFTSAVRSRTLANATPIHTPKKPTVQRDAMKLVDVDGLATLVRLLFLPQALSKTLLHKLLLNLCENSKTRGELISMLLSILQDGSGDVQTIDRNLSRTKGTPKSSQKGKNNVNILSQIVQTSGENVPNLIAQRCLEALTYIVNYNEASVNHFLTEQENIIGLKRSNSKKGKEKQTKASNKYPVVILLSLLDKNVFIKNTSLMDQLMHLLSFVLRPLSTLAKSDSNKSNANKDNPVPESANSNSDEPSRDAPAVAETTATTVNADSEQNAQSNEGQTNGSNDNPAQITEPANSNDTPTVNNVTDPPPEETNEQNAVTNNDNAAAGPSTAKPKTDTETPTLKPPVIPEHCLRLVVNVLTAGECTSNTFKYTLNVIQHLSTLKDAREVITSELVEKAQLLGNDILEDLDELAQVLEQATTGVDVQGVTLSKFSPSSSKQAQLLRVLKTIDYMYSRKQSQTQTSNTQVEVALAPTVDPEQADSATPRTRVGDALPGTKLTEDEEKVMKIYDSLKFTQLWKKLGRCLTTIHEKADMIHVATVLLPLIESLMVVCKYVGMGEPSSSESMDELFMTFTEDHRKILNIMVRNNPSLMSGSFSLLVRNPKILEFDNKRNYFNQQLHKRPPGREHYSTLQLNVRRPSVFEDSFQYLNRRTGDEIKYGKLSVRFLEEEGVDAGGVTREWFQVLARQMFNENYALFKTSAADRLTYQPNRASFVNPEHLLFFKFIGRVIGKAIYDGRLLDAYFTRSFYKHILGKPVDYRDVEAIDLDYYNGLVWMLKNDISDMDDFTFSVEDKDFGVTKIVELKEDGQNIRVTQENKREYVKLVTEQKLTLAIKDQIESFLSGFHEIIPAHLISILNEQELELLISGMPDIDIDDWKNNTEYQNYTASSPQIQWFWRAVRSFDQEERAKLLQFVTGTSKVPLEGFSALQGVHGVQKFQIHKDFASPDRLPSAHTCFNQLDIPEYTSYEQLRSQLLLAISEGTTGFGFQ